MTQMGTASSLKSFDLLSRLVLEPGKRGGAFAKVSENVDVLQISKPEFDQLRGLAETNHVLVRGPEIVRRIAQEAGDPIRAGWAEDGLSAERARISNALSFLGRICSAFPGPVAVIKSLDHLPDLGSDLDLYTNADPDDVIGFMSERFDARLDSRSWGDRLACKWNFVVPGLGELVEIHVGRLGQTGEQFAIAAALIDRTRTISVDQQEFRVPAVSDRIMISTLQRMYRHFYFRLCDVADTAELIESQSIDYDDLYVAAKTAGIWEGVATYLAIVSDYVKHYRRETLDIPAWALKCARFNGERIYFAKDFLRVPILPQSALLYGSQLAGVIRKRQLHSSARLSLLPWLATAALVGQKITGSDKGIW